MTNLQPAPALEPGTPWDADIASLAARTIEPDGQLGRQLQVLRAKQEGYRVGLGIRLKDMSAAELAIREDQHDTDWKHFSERENAHGIELAKAFESGKVVGVTDTKAQMEALVALMRIGLTYIKTAAYNDLGSYSEVTPDLLEQWDEALADYEGRKDV